MISQIRTIAVITLITAMVWVWAESESLATAQETARLVIEAPESLRDQVFIRAVDFPGDVEVELRGSQTAVQAARVRLGELLRPSPEQIGLATADDGVYPIDMARMLGSIETLRATGAEVVSARPGTVSVEVVRLQRVTLPVVAELGDISVDGGAQVSPPLLDVTLPARLAGAAGQMQVRAVVDAEQLQNLPAGEPLQRQGSLVMPEALRNVRGVRPLGAQRATVSFVVRSTTEQWSIAGIPIQITLPPVALETYVIELAPESVAGRARGPREAIERIKSETPVIGVVDVVLGDLREGDFQLAIGYFVRAQGLLRPLPAGVVIEDAPSHATLKVRLRGEGT